MKNTFLKKLVYGSLLLGGITACGNDQDIVPQNNFNNGLQYGAGCVVPVGIKDRTVVGNFGNGATLTLDIYSTPSGTISAIGELVVPSMESLYGFDGGMYNSGYTGAQSMYRTCVSSSGAVGNLERDLSYQEITLALRGNDGTYIEMGETVGPYTAVLVGDAIEGNVKLQVGTFPMQTFLLSR
jgi:hypothetical protein